MFAQNEIIKKGNTYFLANTVIVKVKPGYVSNAGLIKEYLSGNIKGIQIREAAKYFKESSISLNKGEENLNRIFSITIDGAGDPIKIAQKISQLKNIEWAEPKYVRTVVGNLPDDPQYSQQINLYRINAADAWNITHGDSGVVIGIVDTGVDWTHPDLAANIFTNSNYDPNFPNDTHGWDFGGLNGTADNDPHEDLSSYLFGYHGTHVAGIASAVTNNSTGIASIGYNCSILPVKVSRDDRRDGDGKPYVVYGFEGIKYAADKGAKVINCSWGGYSSSNFEQEIINYATSKGALVVAAAGNENSNELFYPASYNNVLSVGWLNTIDDTRAYYGYDSGANYNTMVDVMAPGTKIYSCWPQISGLSYNNASGSSMSAPLVSGLAGLVFTKFPDYTPLQVAERIRVTSDDVYYANSADSVKYMLGRGRINAVRALSEANPISIRATEINFIEEGNGNGLLESNESAQIQIKFTNYLSGFSGGKISIECSDPAVSISDSVFNVGNLNMLQEITTGQNVFKFTVVPNGPTNHTVNFLIRYSGTNYSDYQWISTRINPTYTNHDNNNIELTVTSKGNVAFNDYPNNTEGVGLKYKEQSNVLFEGAFIYGTSADKLMDAARVTVSQSSDFKTLIPVKLNNIDPESEQFSKSVFNDDGAGASKLGIKTTMFTYSFASPQDENYLILRSRLQNTTQDSVNNLYAGFYFDFDIPADSNGFADDMVDYDDVDNFGYAYDLDGQPQQTYIGAALISSDSGGFYAVNQDSSNSIVSPNSSDGFRDFEKWYSISNGIKKTKAGPADIAYIISGGPFNINAGDSIDVAFAIACGEDLLTVKSAIIQSRNKWLGGLTDAKKNDSEIPDEFVLNQNFPNPFNPETVISYKLPAAGNVVLKIYDLLGSEIQTLVNEFQEAGTHKAILNMRHSSLSSGVYFYVLRSGGFIASKKMILLK